MKKFIVLLCFSVPCFPEGFGAAEFNPNGNVILKAGAEKDSASNNYIAVGRYWTGTQYKALIGSYLKATGGQDLNFALGSGTDSKILKDLAGVQLDNLCTAVVYAYSGFIAACRVQQSNGYYDIYLIKFDNFGNLVSSFGKEGVRKANLGGNSISGNAYVRGMVYDPNVGNAGRKGTVVLAGAIGKSSPGYRPFIAAFDQEDGSQYGTTTTLPGISGTAVALAFDSSNSKYYMASTDTSGNHSFYIHQFDTSLLAAPAPWGAKVDFTNTISDGAADSVPAGIAVMGKKIITVGSNRKTTSDAWRCAVTAHDAETGLLDTGFGRVNSPLVGNNNTGITLFTKSLSEDCILNAVASPPSGSSISAIGTIYNGSNYDYLAAQLTAVGAMNAGFGAQGISVQGEGLYDNVNSVMLWLSNSTNYFYGIGRTNNAQQISGASMSKISADTGAFVTSTSDRWTVIPTVGAPSPRAYHSAVWIGSKMIVWGGVDIANVWNTGGSYDPVANAWTPIATQGAPSKRYAHTAVWTGTKMVVFGGYNSSAYLGTGGSYDPATNSWSEISIKDAPTARAYHTSVWTGSQMLVWGGTERKKGGLNSGASYNPIQNSWTALSVKDVPSARLLHSTLWTGTRMLVWGGTDGKNENNTGGSYDPIQNSWTTLSTTLAPVKRQSATAVWTGLKMLIFGGKNSLVLNTGGSYDPVTNSWREISTTGAPGKRALIPATWTGSKMVVWAGSFFKSTYYNSGGSYDPVANTWSTINLSGAPDFRDQHTAVWIGSKILFFGGGNDSANFNTGGIYTP